VLSLSFRSLTLLLVSFTFRTKAGNLPSLSKLFVIEATPSFSAMDAGMALRAELGSLFPYEKLVMNAKNPASKFLPEYLAQGPRALERFPPQSTCGFCPEPSQ